VICAIETVDAMPGTVTRQYAVIALLPAVLAGAALLLRRRAST
jgi:MYXO-CTERM domain-containing protein